MLAENIEDAATYPDDSTLSQPWVRGFAKELHYTYDFGDSWQFTITPKYDAEYLVKAGRVTEKGIKEAIQRVCVLARPVILAADGYPLIDDCGGIDGYVESLRAIEDGDKDSKAWAEGMGWKKKSIRVCCKKCAMPLLISAGICGDKWHDQMVENMTSRE